jgi:hypothetical protein
MVLSGLQAFRTWHTTLHCVTAKGGIFRGGYRMKINFGKYQLLVLLILTDLVLIGIHIVYQYTGLLNHYFFHLGQHRGYGEFFQYIKLLWVVVLFLTFFTQKRQFLYLLYTGLFSYLLFDDSFEFHEAAGEYLAAAYDFPAVFGLREQDLGELLVIGFFAVLFLTPIILLTLKSDQKTKWISVYTLVLILLLGIAGVAFDMVGIMIEGEAISNVLDIFEDGGEMLVVSAITWFVYRLNQGYEPLPLFRKRSAADSTILNPEP